MFSLVLVVLAAAPVKIAAMPPNVVGVEPALAEALLERFATQLASKGELSVVSARDIAQILGLERQRQLMGCSEASCTAELAAALGVDAVLLMTLSKTAKSISTTLKVVNAANGAIVAQDTHRGPDTEATQDWLDGLIGAFTQRIRQELGSRSEPATAGSGSSAHWVLGGAGLALAVGGAVCLGLSAADAGELGTTTSLARIAELERSGPLKRWVGVGLLIGAGVGLTSALVVWLTQSSPRVSLFLVPAAQGALAGIGGVW